MIRDHYCLRSRPPTLILLCFNNSKYDNLHLPSDRKLFSLITRCYPLYLPPPLMCNTAVGSNLYSSIHRVAVKAYRPESLFELEE